MGSLAVWCTTTTSLEIDTDHPQHTLYFCCKIAIVPPQGMLWYSTMRRYGVDYFYHSAVIEEDKGQHDAALSIMG